MRTCALRSTLATTIGLVVAGCGQGAGTPEEPRHLVISETKGQYSAWPSICRTSANDLLVVFTRSEEHLGPDGSVMITRSTDHGETWSAASVLFETPIDDRESGLTVLRDGTIIAHLWSTFHTPALYSSLSDDSYESSVVARWIKQVTAVAYISSALRHGAWQMVSRDGGASWSLPVRGKDSVHGGIELSNGSVLVASYREFGDSIGVYRWDWGSKWDLIAMVGSPEPDSISFAEPHILELTSGRIIMMIRPTLKEYSNEDPRLVLWLTYSDDRGTTWSRPGPTEIWGFPPHLLRLGDGRVLCTYGYRRPPFGQRVCISRDGVTWKLSDEVILRDDAPNEDLGYPASVEIEPGRILTVYYQPNVPRHTVQRMRPPDPNRTKPAIIGTFWQVPPP